MLLGCSRLLLILVGLVRHVVAADKVVYRELNTRKLLKSSIDSESLIKLIKKFSNGFECLKQAAIERRK